MPTIVEKFEAEMRSQGFSEALVRIYVKAFVKGYAEGRAEGRAEEFVEGEVKIIIKALFRRFGNPPESLTNRIHAITDIDELDRLLYTALDCESIDDFERAVESK